MLKYLKRHLQKTMLPTKRILYLVKHGNVFITSPFDKLNLRRCYHGIPFVDLYQRTTGETMSESLLLKLKQKHPNIEHLSHDRLQCTLNILQKFDITALEACKDPHLFIMNPITMDNYGEILKECGFVKIVPIHIIRYHTIVKSRTIAHLKKQGLMREDLNLEENLQNNFQAWPSSHKSSHNLADSNSSILKVRMIVLGDYLNWRLSVTEEEFNKYCRNYLPLKHKPMSDIQEALDIAQKEIKFDVGCIRRNGFIIQSDPVNTKLIIENVCTLAGLDIREAIRLEPAILKNNYNALVQIRNLLEEYQISEVAQRRCLRVFCMCPNSVKDRLEELKNLKEYQVLQTNPRVLSMVVHKRKVIRRLEKIQDVRKQCFSLNHLVASSKVFNTYINSFGNKVNGRDLAILISSSLVLKDKRKTELNKLVLQQLRRHKFWLHAALNVIDENIKFLKQRFDDEVILNNCHLLLYPVSEIENYIEHLLKMRSGQKNSSRDVQLDTNYNSLSHTSLTDSQILSLVLYEIEKKYHFSGDGIWAGQDGVKVDAHAT